MVLEAWGYSKLLSLMHPSVLQAGARRRVVDRATEPMFLEFTCQGRVYQLLRPIFLLRSVVGERDVMVIPLDGTFFLKQGCLATLYLNPSGSQVVTFQRQGEPRAPSSKRIADPVHYAPRSPTPAIERQYPQHNPQTSRPHDQPTSHSVRPRDSGCRWIDLAICRAHPSQRRTRIHPAVDQLQVLYPSFQLHSLVPHLSHSPYSCGSARPPSPSSARLLLP